MAIEENHVGVVVVEAERERERERFAMEMRDFCAKHVELSINVVVVNDRRLPRSS